MSQSTMSQSKRRRRESESPRKRRRTSHINEVRAFPPLLPSDLYFWGDTDSDCLGCNPLLSDGIPKPRKNKEYLHDARLEVVGRNVRGMASAGLRTVYVDCEGTTWSFGDSSSGALGRLSGYFAKDEKETTDPCLGHQLNELRYKYNNTMVRRIALDPKCPHAGVPSPVPELSGDFDVAGFALGDAIGAAWSRHGDVKTWGAFRSHDGTTFISAESRQPAEHPSSVAELTDIVMIAAGSNHLLALDRDGQIFSFGVDEDGVLGRKCRERSTRSLGHPATPTRIPLPAKAVYVAATSRCSFAVDEDGVTWGWEMNGQGQTGTVDPVADAEDIVPLPKPVIGLSEDKRVVQVAGGPDFTLFLTSDGKVYSCGGMHDKDSSLGFDIPEDTSDHPWIRERKHMVEDREWKDTYVATPTAVTLPIDDPVVQIASGETHSLAVTKSGCLYVWGYGSTYQLGLGKDVERQAVPVMLIGIKKHCQLATCGSHFSLALCQDRV